jgi:hypothetical protein
MTPIQQAQEVIDKYQWSLYSVPYCVEVMSGLLVAIEYRDDQIEYWHEKASLRDITIEECRQRIHDLEDQLELTRAASNVEPM